MDEQFRCFVVAWLSLVLVYSINGVFMGVGGTSTNGGRSRLILKHSAYKVLNSFKLVARWDHLLTSFAWCFSKAEKRESFLSCNTNYSRCRINGTWKRIRHGNIFMSVTQKVLAKFKETITHSWYYKMSVIRQIGESQYGRNKKVKHAKFSGKRTFLTPWYANARKKCSFFRKT